MCRLWPHRLHFSQSQACFLPAVFSFLFIAKLTPAKNIFQTDTRGKSISLPPLYWLLTPNNPKLGQNSPHVQFPFIHLRSGSQSNRVKHSVQDILLLNFASRACSCISKLGCGCTPFSHCFCFFPTISISSLRLCGRAAGSGNVMYQKNRDSCRAQGFLKFFIGSSLSWKHDLMFKVLKILSSSIHLSHYLHTWQVKHFMLFFSVPL